ncbi:hypothetical protein ACFT9M_11770 [Micromonospora purpureochromogenes]|uniref:hypothetical protein n=1 Tax=Micromonospora purpureochromogenes TaxID=47872 RepID=UPI003632430F
MTDTADAIRVPDVEDEARFWALVYCRGWIVALGREFHEAVCADPAMAVLDADCGEMCYFFAHLHQERFGEWPDTGSGISRESTSNAAGWAAS